MLKEERAQNAALVEALLRRDGLLERETNVTIEPHVAIGREPWYKKKARLEKLFGESNASEIHETVREDAGSTSRSDNGE